MSLKTISFASFTKEDSLDVSGEISGCIFFWILMYALFTSSFVKLFEGFKFKILYASWVDIVLKFEGFWLLKENLPEFLKVWINLYREINWKIERPFNFKSAKLASVKGRVNKTFPPIANNTAKTANIINNKILKPLDIFFDATPVKYLSKKYKPAKINTV